MYVTLVANIYNICKYVSGETFLFFFSFLIDEVWIKPKLELGVSYVQ